MRTLVDRIAHDRCLLFVGQSAGDSGAFLPAFERLAQVPFRKVVALAEVPDLVAAWRRAGRDVVPVALTDTPPQLSKSQVTWLTLPSSQAQEPPWFSSMLRAWFATHTIIFLHCDLENPVFKHHYRAASHAVGPHRPTYYALTQHPLFEGDRHYWEAHNVNIIEAVLETWVDQLVEAWTRTSQVKRAMDRRTCQPSSGLPYKFLDYYTDKDADRFFGRTAAVQSLAELVLTERLVIYFGASGVGKTSLLQAGLVPYLRDYGCLPIYTRPMSDPVQAIQQGALSLGARAQPQGTLSDLLSDLADQTQRTVIVLLDQFEEVFALLGATTMNHLVDELAACLRSPSAPVHVVLSTREDFLVYLHTLQPHLPNVFAHRYRLRPLSREEARKAIEEPVHGFGLRYEPDLTERLLDDLSDQRGIVKPTDLQIVCDALYRDLKAVDRQVFSLDRYRALGGVEAILAGYLQRVVEQDVKPDQMRAVFKAMVTTQGTKASLPPAEIARLSGLPPDVVIEILQRLDSPHRLVRALEQEGATLYEIAHEVLCSRILAWIEDPAERQAKAIHDLLRAELHNSQHFGALPGPGKLRAVHTQWDNPYLRLRPDEVQLLLRSALHHDVDLDIWLERAGAVGVEFGDFLLPALTSPQAEVRRRAAALLGSKRTIAALSESIRTANPQVRAQAAVALGEAGSLSAFQILRQARHDAVESVRAAVQKGLEAIDPRAAHRLRLRDEAAPLLLAGSIVYWLLLVLNYGITSTPSAWPNFALAGSMGLVAIVLIWGPLPWILAGSALTNGRTPEGNSFHRSSAPWSLGRLAAGGVPLLALGCLLIAAWGWIVGGVGLLLLLVLIGNKYHLALSALLAYLSFLGPVPVTPILFLWVTDGVLVTLSLLALDVSRWGNYGINRPAAIALLITGIGAVLGALLVGSDGVALGSTTLLALSLSAGRWWARRSLAYSGGVQNVRNPLEYLVDVSLGLWDTLDQASFKIKPLVGGMLGIGLGGSLLEALAWLLPDAALPLRIGHALWLGIGLAVGMIWAEGNLLKALLLPTLGGTICGALAHGMAGAVIGSGIGMGLGIGEWVAFRLAPSPGENTEVQE